MLEKVFFSLAQRLKKRLAVDWLYSAGLYFIVATIERVSYLHHLCQIPGHRIFYQVVGGAARFGG